MTIYVPPQTQAKALREILNNASQAYYLTGESRLTDSDYDQLLEQLKALEQQHPELADPDSPTQRVGAPVQRSVTVQHRVPMLSLDNVFTEDGALKFAQKIQSEHPDATFNVEYKVDGISLALIYENGRLVSALTRGNGEQGEDVTHAARAMRGVPLALTKGVWGGRIEIRGEAYIDPADFEEIRHEPGRILANPRAAAIGAVTTLDPMVTWRRKVRFIAHGFGVIDDNPSTTYDQLMNWVEEQGILGCYIATRIRAENLATHLKKAIEVAAGTPFPTDGLVIKVNDFDVRDQLGFTSHHVRWAIAYKWEQIEKVTKLNSVTLQVGRTGVITPVAELEPVEIDQTMVARASLHNFSEIKRLDLHIGDTVVVEKAGKIIPHVLRVLSDLRPMLAVLVVPPTSCPACRSPVAFEGEYLRCTNLDCAAAKLQQLIWAVGKEGLDIEGLGDTFVEQLFQAGFFQTFGDLYGLAANEETILEKTDIGKARLDKILIAIEQSKKAPLHKLITAFGIDGVGVGTGKVLAERFGNLGKIAEAAQNPAVLQGPGVGSKAAAAISQFFARSDTHELLETLQRHGVSLERYALEATSQKLAGQTVLITGTCSRPREEVQCLIERHGGISAKGWSKKVTLLVVGESPGSKLEKATAAGVPTIPAEQFLTDLLG